VIENMIEELENVFGRNWLKRLRSWLWNWF